MSKLDLSWEFKFGMTLENDSLTNGLRKYSWTSQNTPEEVEYNEDIYLL